MLSVKQKVIKRFIDIIFSLSGITLLIIPISILVLLSTIINNEFGIFFQKRVGEKGVVFTIFKIKTMKLGKEDSISSFGKFLRITKLDEFPQLFNVLFGQMSIVGPRPDIKGYADELQGEDRIILSVKPGLTSPAALFFSDEESLLSKQENPLKYNDEVLWPKKVELNKEYVQNWSLKNDFKIILKTIKIIFN
ncbi:lipopolysaccharide/colanic/teichoic acid biosynthesis glycosyltransferase [Lutibacter sp. Hel_I_33_5]|uniref:sugar transferase n=1 Tax=Lutibacter sp. Hel_I_33_5 TaxID=1566289 RepID=UPI0011A58F57|nr:sugar transferase [Lutibacter sp. Hel_I_33_5]TVZ55179.1 lipopolysaccharide/colanic/teichoic acid biosynthesis glycosyltransferase [Lutibacter sp. Hel_I_33_5]